jgi:hypothetical protein
MSPFVNMFQSVRSCCACDVINLLMQAKTNKKDQAREDGRLGRAIVRAFGLSRYHSHPSTSYQALKTRSAYLR